MLSTRKGRARRRAGWRAEERRRTEAEGEADGGEDGGQARSSTGKKMPIKAEFKFIGTTNSLVAEASMAPEIPAVAVVVPPAVAVADGTFCCSCVRNRSPSGRIVSDNGGTKLGRERKRVKKKKYEKIKRKILVKWYGDWRLRNFAKPLNKERKRENK